MLPIEAKAKIIKKHKLHDTDTGSTDVQVALISQEIETLLLHLKKHPKDLHSKRGLLKMVNKRRSLLKYLQKIDDKRHASLTKELGIKAS